MRTKLSKIAQAATLGLAMTFTLSCSSGGSGGDPGDNGGGGGGGKGNDIANYRTVVIGNQTWMAENLNYAVSGSKCYGEGGRIYVDHDQETNTAIYTKLSNAEIQANCNTYGRLYDWSTAMDLPSSCNVENCASQIGTPHRGICPSGWHIPSNADWDKLYRYADGTSGASSPYNSEMAGTKLKSASGWNSYSNVPLGTDAFGFSALPGGFGLLDDEFSGVGGSSYWWSANELGAVAAYDRLIFFHSEGAYYSGSSKSNLFSVRCLQD